MEGVKFSGYGNSCGIGMLNINGVDNQKLKKKEAKALARCLIAYSDDCPGMWISHLGIEDGVAFIRLGVPITISSSLELETVIYTANKLDKNSKLQVETYAEAIAYIANKEF